METKCWCGAILSGDDIESVVAVAVGHFGDIHADWQLSDTQIRNYVEVVDRVDGPTDRLDAVGEIDVRRVSTETLGDILEFFDRRAFADNPGWGMCYCMYHHIGGGPDGEWPKQTWQDNRSGISDRIKCGQTTGVVAYVDGVLAGWCNASARDQFPFKADGADAGIGSIACFVVAPPYRGHGVQKALLSGAISMLADQGFEYAEGYPIREFEGSGRAFVGTLGLFEAAGFEIVSEDPLRVQLAL